MAHRFQEQYGPADAIRTEVPGSSLHLRSHSLTPAWRQGNELIKVELMRFESNEQLSIYYQVRSSCKNAPLLES